MQTLTYEGELPCADCPGIRYDLTIRSREHSGDGTFSLHRLTWKPKTVKMQHSSTTGKRLTLRGIPGDDNATVWQLISDNGNETMNFLCENDSTITLIGDDFKKAESGLNYSLKRIK